MSRPLNRKNPGAQPGMTHGCNDSVRTTPEQRRRAALYVAERIDTPDDLRLILDMLGLIEGEQ